MHYIPVSVRHKRYTRVDSKADNIAMIDVWVAQRHDSLFVNSRLRSIRIYGGTQIKEVSRDLLRVNQHDRLAQQTSKDNVTWKNYISYCEQIVAALTICRFPSNEVQPRPSRIMKTKNTAYYGQGGGTRRQRRMRTIVPIFSAPA